MTPQSRLTGISYIKVTEATIQKNVAVQEICLMQLLWFKNIEIIVPF
jgi:hypothetical protein